MALTFVAAQAGDSAMSNIWVAAITGAATLAGSWLLFRGNSKQAAAESIVEERKLLSAEWGKIREAVDQALQDCRDERDELREQVDELRLTVQRLETEVQHLRTRGQEEPGQ